ncbi:(2Fe-2S)-binding protein [bacterium]|nr:(2Fe-2S)-binding protein [bacterium]
MKPDDELCLCFHVSMRKVQNFCRIEKPQRASQLSECGGAGTGCGWCRPFLERIFESQKRADSSPMPSADEYRKNRAQYIREKNAGAAENS